MAGLGGQAGEDAGQGALAGDFALVREDRGFPVKFSALNLCDSLAPGNAACSAVGVVVLAASFGVGVE
ncbi:hypothetical protein, partial [Streptomyces sp. NPDC056304]|uniref:hypothetical protein n=1 Tax=Streptomyces sp. NPDC056304 TaxID=3345778 RepID=UPI0035D9F26F